MPFDMTIETGDGEISKFKLPFLPVVLAVTGMPAVAGDRVLKRVLASAVAFHLVFDLSYVTGEFVGYVGFIEGVDCVPVPAGRAVHDLLRLRTRPSGMSAFGRRADIRSAQNFSTMDAHSCYRLHSQPRKATIGLPRHAGAQLWPSSSKASPS